MMKVIYLYLALVFGGAFIAFVYFRAQDRGWPSTIVFLGALLVASLVQSYRARRRRMGNSREASETEDP